MNITIDCRMIDSSGVGVYLRECLPCFLQSEHQWTLLGEPVRLQQTVGAFSRAQILECRIKPFSIEELFFFPRRITGAVNKTDIYYSPYFNIPGGIRIPVYTTIHDMVFADIPEMVSKTGLFLRMYFLRRASALSTKILTVSNYSKSRIEYHLGTKKSVIVTYSAIQPSFLEFKSEVNEKKKSIVFIGNIKKHKGLDVLIDAFIEAGKNGLSHKLIIVGNADNFRTRDNRILKKIDSLEPGTVEFTGYISQSDLLQLLAEAALLVQPSIYEGFCLPPLEAMVLGTPALISDIPVLREVYADFPVVFFKAGDRRDLQEKLETLLMDKEPERVTLSGELLNRYTFDRTAKTILESLP